MYKNITEVKVYLKNDEQAQFVGVITLDENGLSFTYDKLFIASEVELSPFKLPLRKKTFIFKDWPFGDIFGLFNDVLPDGWGRRLLDRKLIDSDIAPSELTVLDRLSFIDNNALGALVYEPQILQNKTEVLNEKSLDDIFDIVHVIETDQPVSEYDFDNIFSRGGSSVGARPKIHCEWNNEAWIVKFRSSEDAIDSGNIEYAYNLMAKKAGLVIPNIKLFKSKKCPGYFAVQRFDRVCGKRLHMQSISGLMHANFRMPSLDYYDIMRLTALLTKNIKMCEQQFRAATFNILSHNRDDHVKNFSFLMKDSNYWEVSPSYDLTYSSGPGGEHCTGVNKRGKNHTKKDFIDLAKVVDIAPKKATAIIEEVLEAVLKWPQYAKEAGVSSSSQKKIYLSIQFILKNFAK